MTEQEQSNLEKLRQITEAQKARRPDADPNELLLSVTDEDATPATYDEFNARGEEMAFICMRVADQPEPLVPTATGKKCEDCGEGVWMSPGTFDAWLKIKRGVVLCIQCAFRRKGIDYDDLKAAAVRRQEDTKRPEE